MDIGLILDFYAIKSLSLIFINLLVTFLIQRFNAPASNHPDLANPMDTPDAPHFKAGKLLVSTLTEKCKGD